MNQLQINKLYTIAGGLNIEGGLPAQYLLRDNPDKIAIWSNIILILDRPIIDNVLFEELDKRMKSCNYPLLENTIDEINEHQMFAIYLMVVGYYLKHGRNLLCKNATDSLSITIHLHQDYASRELNSILSDMINNLCENFKINMSNTMIQFKIDNPIFISTEHNYNDTDILISLSQCAGLDPYLKPGEMIISNEFIPYNIITKEINIKVKYTVENDLLKSIDDILKSPYHEYSINYVNDNYVSVNKTKQHNARKLIGSDFNVTSILQVDALWNPLDEEELVTIIE